jgi:hypothetical protein
MQDAVAGARPIDIWEAPVQMFGGEALAFDPIDVIALPPLQGFWC